MVEPSRHYTYGDYVKWPEHERWELIEGVAYDMTTGPPTQHQRVSGKLLCQIDNFLTGKPCELLVAPLDVLLPEADEPEEEVETVVQPDLLVVCDPKKLEDDRFVRGAPDFIIEILSPLTAAKDQIRKRDLYQKHGVREYWLVHPTDRVVTIYLLGEDGRYPAPAFVEATGRIAVATLPGLEIDFDRVFPPQPTPEPGNHPDRRRSPDHWPSI